MDDLDQPLPPDHRFAVELARFLDGRSDPSRNAHPAANPPVDVFATLLVQEQLDRILG